MNENGFGAELKHMVAEVVIAYVTHNSVRSDDLPGVIATVHQAFVALDEPAQEVPSEPLVKPVSARKSITPDFLISMEDGRQYKSLKRHLAGRGLTPAEYRTKWSLPGDYPMVAESYAKRRSDLAKSFGLGRSRAKAEIALKSTSEAAAKPKRGRKKAPSAAA